MIAIDVVRGEEGLVKEVVIDGVSFPAASGMEWYHEDKRSVSVGTEAAALLLERSYSELEPHFDDLVIEFSEDSDSLFPQATIVFPIENNLGRKQLFIEMRPYLSSWTKPWSFTQYMVVFNDLFERSACEDYVTDEHIADIHPIPYMAIVVKELDQHKAMKWQVEKIRHFVEELHNECVRNLTANLNKGSLVTYFDFPPTVKVACEQYLQYFIQFLDDLGIEAESQIASDAGKVLFTVTPLDGEKALESIQEALAAYLEMPKAAAGGAQFGIDVAQTQLHANVLHLQSQLMLAQSMMQMGQATIQAKDATINSQRAELALYQRGQLVQSDASSSSFETRDSESLIPGYVSVTKMKIKGVEIDLPKIVRALKRKLPGVNG